MSFFTQESDKKRRVLQNLKDAIIAIEEGRVDILEEVMVNSHSDGMGYTRHGKTHDSMFFGFEYVITRPKAQPAPVQFVPPQASIPEPVLSTPTYEARLSNCQLERMKQNGSYTCTKCGKFTTTSGTGMKKHYNRCGGT